jgi:chromosome segregation ATPase
MLQGLVLASALFSIADGSRMESAMKTSEQMLMSERPTAKVVALLKDMGAQLEKEGEEDEALYDKMACWCETNDKLKTKAIEDGTEHQTALNAAIEEFTAKSAQLTAEIEGLKKDIAEKTQGLDKATQIREKEASEFHSEETDLIGSITALKGAIITLSKHQALNQEDLMRATRLIQMHARARPGMFANMVPDGGNDLQDLFQSFLQNQVHHHTEHVSLSLLQTRSQSKSRTRQPASGQIFGILKQMKETFERNLESSQENEKNAAETYRQVKTAKTEEINAAKRMVETKSTELSDSDSNNAMAKEDLEDTTATLTSDTEFLRNLKLKCQAADKEWEDRKKTRHDELSAVSEAIEILTNDDAKDLFRATLGFTQKSAMVVRRGRSRAAAILRRASVKSKSRNLSELAVRMRLDSFKEVKASIDKMAGALKDQQSDEIKQKDYCNEELNMNSRQTDAKSDLKDDLTTKMNDLSSSIGTLNEEIESLKAEIADMQMEVKKASEARQAENHEYQMTIADQVATQNILMKAIDRLKQFYAKKLFLMQRTSDIQAPPESFKSYKKNGGGAGVIAMLEGIVADAKDMVEKARAAENEATAAYEAFVKDTGDSIGAKATSITNKLEERAKLDAQSTHANSDAKHTEEDLQALSRYAAGVHGDCDFLLKNFEERQASRAEEIDALGQAKAIFSGADLR